MVDSWPSSIARAVTEEAASRLVAQNLPFVYRTGQTFELQRFLDRYGDSQIKVSEEDIYLMSSNRTMTVRSYRESCELKAPCAPTFGSPKQPYAFHDVTWHDPHLGARPAFDPFEGFVLGGDLPEFFSALSDRFDCVAARVALGPAHSHANVHYHGAALNQLLHGEKLWRIFHPYVAEPLRQLAELLHVPNKYLFFEREVLPIASDHSGDISGLIRQKFMDSHEQGLCSRPDEGDPLWYVPLHAELVRGISFSQIAGDSVFIPPSWGHAVENRCWTLCRIYELESPSLETKHRSVTRELDDRGAVISIRPGHRLSFDAGRVIVETSTTKVEADKIVLAVIPLVDGETSASAIAARTSDPEAALYVLQRLDGVLFTRSIRQTSFNKADWDRAYTAGGYKQQWELGTPSMATVAFLAGGRVQVGGSVLDVGCGAGTDTVYMAKHGYRAHGVDVSDEAIRIAQTAATEHGVDVQFKCESVTSMSFSNSSMEAVFDRGCLHSLSMAQWDSYFEEVFRVLKPSGRLIITGRNESDGYFTPLRRDSFARFEDRFAIEQFETSTMATSQGHMPVTFAVLRSKKHAAA